MIGCDTFPLGLDIVVCSAGGSHDDTMRPHSEVCLEAYKGVMDINFMSAVALTKEALPHLEETRGNILYVSSVAGMREGFFTCVEDVGQEDTILVY